MWTSTCTKPAGRPSTSLTAVRRPPLSTGIIFCFLLLLHSVALKYTAAVAVAKSAAPICGRHVRARLMQMTVPRDPH